MWPKAPRVGDKCGRQVETHAAQETQTGSLGPHEFTLVSPLSPTLGALGCMSLHLSPTCLPHLSPTLGSLGHMSLHLSPPCLPHLSLTLGALDRMSLHLSPPCLPLWVSWAAWVYTCLPLVSHSGCLGPHEFTLVSHLSRTLVSHSGFLGPLSLHLSPPCLPLWVPWAAWVYTCHSGCLGPHEFTLVSPLSPTLVPWVAWVYTCLVYTSPPCLPLFTLVSHTCLPLWVPWAA